MTSSRVRCRGSEYKTRCGKFKRLGDEIQGNCITNNGYTWDFYFLNELIDPELLAQGYCPMHCRLLHMFQNLHESFHCCTMDNLFYSVKLSHAVFCLKKLVLVHGVLRKSGRGCPPHVFQEEKAGRAANAARVRVKAAVLKGDDQSSDLVVASCYDQKPFYISRADARVSHGLPSQRSIGVPVFNGRSTLRSSAGQCQMITIFK